MKSLQLTNKGALSAPSVRLRLLGVTLFGLISSFAFGAEGEGIHLRFGSQDKMILGVSAALGLLGVIIAYFIGQGVLKNSRGSQGMQDVQDAIEDGARAYLKKQINMMIPFIGILAVLLFFLYKGALGAQAALVSLTFVLGVGSSYFSGFAGMIMAVKANARVAAAALTSNKKALEIAFRSGSVAGLLTVGLGLFFSCLILIAMPAKATILLVGYGFGGSLAALFMRVGGGIFTKAADVGADLVGKVEQSMPEDSPLNPATIADNVGDNVGDCAGMAADVFESYEVMLVATIVLGAATSAVLDASVWPKLIVFALAACAVGIVASLIGIQTVSGSDDTESDPLKPILRGFRISAIVSVLGIAGLAAMLLGNVSVQELVTPKIAQTRMQALIVSTRDRIALETKKDKTAVTAKEVMKDPAIASMEFKEKDEQMLTQLLATPADPKADLKGLAGYVQVSDEEIQSRAFPALFYALSKIDPTQPQKPPTYQTVAEAFDPATAKRVAAKVRLVQKSPSQGGAPPQDVDEYYWLAGPSEADLNNIFANYVKDRSKEGTVVSLTPDKTKILDMKLFYNKIEDKFAAVAVVRGDGVGIDRVEKYQLASPLVFYRQSVSDIQAFDAKQKADPKSASTPPEAVQFETAAAVIKAKAGWWLFALAVIFGILMAIGIEGITNYYVGTKNKPTREVAGVSSAGPAPMIIQGFALGLESSVFMVLAIVLALMVPLFLFPVATFGSMYLGYYGIALIGLGLLTTTAFILAMDTFGPISDNAQGVFEMSGEGGNEYGSKSLQRLDAAGNTTKALTKGFAIATAVVAAVALFQSFVESGHLQESGLRLDVPEIFMGLLIGGAATFLFSSFAINAVGRAAFELMIEVRRQFRENPGILLGTSKPEYGKCVELVTAAAQRELLAPGILAICLPIAVGFGFSLLPGTPVTIGDHVYNLRGAQALGGFLAGAIVCGPLMAVMLANSGGIWDNAKKLIEDGFLGHPKDSDAHRDAKNAAVVCDTVGDPFKDTAGPALNPLIKVMNLVGLLSVGVIIDGTIGTPVRAGVTVVALGLLVFAFWRSKQGSLADQLQHMNDSK
ncbi:MAG: sodium/proton-translocating pyrophosphatase [Armatimonadota bacterium]